MALSDKEIIAAYDALVVRAIEIARDYPFNAYIDEDNGVLLKIDGDKAILSWCTYDSDYYGGGSISHDAFVIRSYFLSLSDKELADYRKRERAEEAERNRKVTEARVKVAADRKRIAAIRAEERDKVEFERLKNKFKSTEQ